MKCILKRLWCAATLWAFAAFAVLAQNEPAAIELDEVAEGVWVHTSYQALKSGARISSNGMIVRDGAGLLLVDTAWGTENTQLLLGRIRSEIGLPVTRAIVTHAHDDRMSGVALLEAQGVEVYATAETRQLAAGRGLPVPAHTLELAATPGSTALFGPLEVMFPGAAHTTDNITVWVPAAGVLAGGCAVREAAARTLGNYKDGEPQSWGGAMARLARRYGTAQLVVPGHGSVGDVRLMAHTAKLVQAHLAGEGVK